MAFENTRTVLGITNGPMRSAIKGALMAKGFRAIAEVTSMIALHEILERDGADLVITTSKLGYDDTIMLLREVRHHRLGNNPFIITMMLLESPEKDDLAKVVNAGVDDVLLMPVSSAQLIGRIENIKRARKPFIFAYDYVGPDRRKEERPGAAPPLTFEPPNPLKLRDEQLVDEGRYNGLIRNGMVVYKRFMLAVQVRQVEWLSGQIAVGCRDAGVPLKDTVTHVARLMNMSQDLGKRLTGDEHRENLTVLTGLTAIAREISNDPRAAKSDLLSKLVDAAKDLKSRLAPSTLTASNPASKTW